VYAGEVLSQPSPKDSKFKDETALLRLRGKGRPWIRKGVFPLSACREAPRSSHLEVGRWDTGPFNRYVSEGGSSPESDVTAAPPRHGGRP
jgi:hypothetical protein